MRFGFSQKKSYICIRNTEGTDCIAVPSFFTPKKSRKNIRPCENFATSRENLVRLRKNYATDCFSSLA